jgi:hypothetical protein
MIYGAAARMDIRKVSLDHIHFDANELKNMLLPVLRNEALKETKNLKLWATKLISVCRNNLAEIIDFNSNELNFLTNIIEHGEITPELITRDDRLIESIKKHPVLLWKAMNVKEHNKKNS